MTMSYLPTLKAGQIIRCFLEVILGTFWPIAFFLVGAKTQNSVNYSVFALWAWKKYFLQHGENCVNTNVLLATKTL